MKATKIGPVQTDKLGRSLLHYAANEANAGKVQELLASGCDPNLQDKSGWSPLHFAAQASSLEVTELLLAAGANVHLRDSFGNTPLFRAVFSSKGSGTVIQALKAAGADPAAVNAHGVSPHRLAHTIANYDVAQFFSDVWPAQPSLPADVPASAASPLQPGRG